MFTAIDGQGAFCNGKQLSASGQTVIGESLVACSFPAGVKGGDPEVQRFVRVLEDCRSLRRLGSCALNMCYVAAGRLDAYWATAVCAWDSAAGTVIARESGAHLTAYNGAAMDDWNPKFVVAGSVSLNQTIIGLLAQDS